MIDRLNRRLSEVLSCSVSSQGTPEIIPACIWEQTFSLCSGPALWLVTGEDCPPDWVAALTSAMDSLADAISRDLGRPVTAGTGRELDAEPSALAWTIFESSGAEAPSFLIKAAWSNEMENLDTPQSSSASRTLDVLLEVALPVSVSFGKTLLQIREALKLSTGSIVELNRLVSDPVDVIVNDCVIARGEVVVVDGNYGVRISELASREDRLRTGMVDFGPLPGGRP